MSSLTGLYKYIDKNKDRFVEDLQKRREFGHAPNESMTIPHYINGIYRDHMEEIRRI